MRISALLSAGTFISAALVIQLSCSTEKDKILRKPNFLLLMSDNQSWNHLGCYGDAVVHSPAIDSLALEGVRFTNSYCAAPS
jgi:arylsulfatase A-like enzyme